MAGDRGGPSGDPALLPQLLVVHRPIALTPLKPTAALPLTRCCCLGVTKPHRNHLSSETAGFACSLGEERQLLS
jgi:hypothetical protein